MCFTVFFFSKQKTESGRALVDGIPNGAPPDLRYGENQPETPIDAVATAHTPITMRLDDGTHLAFHEAALVDYSGMWLKRVEGRKFRATLAPSSRGPRVVRDLPSHTPWRTIRIADDAEGLVENDLDLHLNETKKPGDARWIQPR